jgi:hypothetical protein
VGFKLTVAGRLCGMRQWIPSGVSVVRWGILWNSSTGKILRAYDFNGAVTLPSNNWMNLWFRPWVRINTTDNYRVAMLVGTAYHRTNTALTVPVTNNGIQFISSFQSTTIDVVAATLTTNTNANGVDVLFQAD